MIYPTCKVALNLWVWPANQSPSWDSCYKRKPTPDTAWRTKSRDWIVQSPRIEPNMSSQWNDSAILIDQNLKPSIIIIRKSSSSNYGHRCRSPQPNIRLDSGNSEEDGGHRSQKRGQEHKKNQSQQPGFIRCSGRLKWQSGSLQGSDLGSMHVCYGLYRLIFLWEIVFDSFTCSWDHFSSTRLPCPA